MLIIGDVYRHIELVFLRRSSVLDLSTVMQCSYMYGGSFDIKGFYFRICSAFLIMTCNALFQILSTRVEILLLDAAFTSTFYSMTNRRVVVSAQGRNVLF